MAHPETGQLRPPADYDRGGGLRRAAKRALCRSKDDAVFLVIRSKHIPSSETILREKESLEKKGKEGFTLMEFAIGFILTSLLAGLLLSLFFYSNTAFLNRQRALLRENYSHQIRQQLVDDFLYSTTLDARVLDAWSLQNKYGEIVHYAWRDSLLFRNDVLMHEDELRIQAFEIRPLIGPDSLVWNLRGYEILAELEGWGLVIEDSVSVMLRLEEEWTPAVASESIYIEDK